MRSPAVAAVLAALALAAAPTAASACGPAHAPTRAQAWRAYVPVGTPLRAHLAASTQPLPLTYDPGWRLVLRARRTAWGACLLRIRIDRRPNASAAWVAATRVRLARTPWRIEVRRATRRATLLQNGHAVARWPVVVGKPSTPTPTGTFAIQQAYKSPPSSFSGAWILALTAHSTVLRTFDGGDGQVALHGRGGPALHDPLGTAASHGCIRFANTAITTIVRRIGRTHLQGTPVSIR
jgi:lipoprotein-anchoring transpeptidase ErfK/SrfK